MQYKNILRYANFLLSGVDRLLPRARLLAKPLTAEIDINNYCNLRCPHCLREMPNQEFNLYRLGLKDLVRLSPWLKSMLGVRLGGSGEPFLQKDLLDVVDHVHASGGGVCIISNATLINEEAARRMCGEKPLLLVLSIDAGTPEVFERIRLGAKFDEVAANLDRLARIRKEKNATYPVLNINMTLMRDTLPEIESVIRLAKRWGVAQINAVPMVIFSDKVDPAQAVSNEEAQAALDGARQLASELGVAIQYFPMTRGFDDLAGNDFTPAEQESNGLYYRHSRSKGKANSYFCPNLWFHLWLNPAGEVMPCCLVDFGTVGSIRKSDMGALWNSKKMVAMRRSLLKGTPPPECLKCSMLEHYDRRWMVRLWKEHWTVLRQTNRG